MRLWQTMPPDMVRLVEDSDEKTLQSYLFDSPILDGLSNYDKMTLVTKNYDKLLGGIYIPLVGAGEQTLYGSHGLH